MVMANYTMRPFAKDAALSAEETVAAPLRCWPQPSLLAQPVTKLDGVGKVVAGKAGRLGIENLNDLIEHIPFRYEDMSRRLPIAELVIGQDVTVMAEVQSLSVRPTRRRSLKLLECIVSDSTAPMKAVWFNQQFLADQLKPGTNVLLHGRLTRDRKGPSFQVKSYELVANGGPADGERSIHTLGLVPFYPSTEALPQRRMRQMAWQAQNLAGSVVEPLPVAVRAALGLPSRRDAIKAAHFPDSLQQARLARRRLAFDELFLLQLALLERKRRREEQMKAAALTARGELTERWLASLPFGPTQDQVKAFDQIDSELVRERPMQRLLMGEVGSGKTVVALYAMLRAVESGGQAALMAPTETLAEQHFQTVDRLTGGLERVALLTSSTPAKRRRQIVEGLSDGSMHMAVGTHALIEEGVAFNDLKLAVVDEQHRFGVKQRSALDAKRGDGRVPHVLHMTATPIPRTLALVAYGDLDVTALKELPKGRKRVGTWDVTEEKRPGAYGFIRKKLKEGRQCYLVCPLVEHSSQLQAKAAVDEAKRLARHEFRDFRVAYIHGQMPAQKKRAAMSAFKDGQIDLLVATSVIEVGIDVPNATVIMIEHAERYGLSQLHQLRGRVGRGDHESHCILFSNGSTDTARARLEAMARCSDGFELAEIDLELRGEGEIVGTRQSGLPAFKAARLPRDFKLLASARRLAGELLDRDAELGLPQNALLREKLRAQHPTDEKSLLVA